MKKLVLFLILIISISILESCKPAMNVRNSNKRAGITRVKQFTSQKGKREKGTLLWAHYDPTKRQALMFIDTAGNIKILAEQSPDAGLSRSFELSPKVKIEGAVDVEVLIKTQAELAKLTNRTTSLMITREALYRLSEAYFNGAVGTNRFVELYKEIIYQARNLVLEETKLEEAKAKTAQAEAEKARIAAELEKEKMKHLNLKKEEPKKEEKKEDKS